VEGKWETVEFTQCCWIAGGEPLGFAMNCWRGNWNHLNSQTIDEGKMGTIWIHTILLESRWGINWIDKIIVGGTMGTT